MASWDGWGLRRLDGPSQETVLVFRGDGSWAGSGDCRPRHDFGPYSEILISMAIITGLSTRSVSHATGTAPVACLLSAPSPSVVGLGSAGCAHETTSSVQVAASSTRQPHTRTLCKTEKLLDFASRARTRAKPVASCSTIAPTM